MADNEDKEAYKERLKAAIWHYANEIVQEESEALEATATPQFISALADLVYAQAGRNLNDCFAGHAKRSVINVDDVKLCCRRNEGLAEIMDDYAEEVERRKRLEKEKKEGQEQAPRPTAIRGRATRGRGRGR